jgi:2-hydroxymuconate-semialdehyde hydrolase
VSAPITTRDVAAGEWSFHVSTSGDPGATPVVFLHGSGPGVTALSNWEGALGALGDDFYCVAPDIVGFGDSTHPEEPPVGIGPFLDLRATSMIELLDALGLARVHLVGNSMGGMLTLKLLGMVPERIESAILMGSGGAPVPPTENLMKLAGFYADPTEDAMTDLLERFVYDPSSLGSDLRAIAAARMPRVLRDDVRRSHVATFTFTGGPVVFDHDQLAAVTQPVLLIHGRDDTFIPYAASLYFLDHLPNADLHVLARAGHWAQIEQPERFRMLVRGFVGGAAKIHTESAA